MVKKRIVRKKKKIRRLGRLLAFVLLVAATVGLILYLLLRPAAGPAEAAPKSGDGLWDGSWYSDDLGRIDGDRALVKGMEAFRKKTGVRPYLTLLDGIEPAELDDFAEAQYEALFTDGEHLLVVYDEWGDGEYYLSAQVGADSSLTAADQKALLDGMEKAYADPANKSYAEAFGAGFAQAAQQMSSPSSAGGAITLLVVALILLLLGVAVILVLRKRALRA